MEESQKRRERLKAMCMGGAQAETVSSQNVPISPGSLVSPLSQPSSAQTEDRSSSFSRFDYYTNPMAAFHGNKRGSNISNACPDNLPPPLHNTIPGALPPPNFTVPRESPMTPIPATANQFQVNRSPHLGPHEIQSPTSQYAPWQSPVGMGTLYSSQNPIGVPGSWNRETGSSGPGVPYNASPDYFTSPGGQGSSPGIYSGRGRHGNFSGGQRSSPGTYSGRGRHGNFSGGRGSSPGAYSGRGRHGNFSGRGNVNMYSRRINSSPFGNSPSSHPGWSSSRQKDSQEHVLACEKPHIFYSKVMVEDPWNELEPVVRKILVPFTVLQAHGSSDSWLPKSVALKKAKVDETSSGRDSSDLNLAEYLARSFEDAVSDAPVT